MYVILFPLRKNFYFITLVNVIKYYEIIDLRNLTFLIKMFSLFVFHRFPS